MISGNDRLVIEIPMATQNIRDPVVFYSGGTLFEV